MEDNLHVENGENLIIDWRSKEFLKETAKWTKFLAILGFVGIGLMVLISLFIVFANSMLPENIMPFGSRMMIVFFYMIFAIIYCFPVYYLYKFSTNMKVALMNNDSKTIQDAFEFLKSHYRFIGIMMVIVFSLYAISIFIALIGAGATAMMN